MSITLLDRLAERQVEIPVEVGDKVAMIEAAKQLLLVPLDAAGIINTAFAAGELNPQNLEDRLVAAAEREMLSSPRYGSPTWQLAKQVQSAAELDIASWYARSRDDIISQLALAFDKQATIINELAPKALPENAPAEQVLKLGQKALDARNQVAVAEAAALELWALLQEVAQAASRSASFALIADPGDGPLPLPEMQHRLADIVREGVKLGVNTPERVAEIDAAEAERARQAELDSWKSAIEQDELRLDGFRQRGETSAQGPIPVPQEYEHLRAEARAKHGILLASERFHGRRAGSRVA